METSNGAGLRFVCGIISSSKEMMFERMLFRATRGNMFFNRSPAGELVTDPISGDQVFVLFCFLSGFFFFSFYCPNFFQTFISYALCLNSGPISCHKLNILIQRKRLCRILGE
jgi:V-type ATPase 116kDa subunit family